MALILYTVTVIDHVNNPNNTLANADIVIRTTQAGTPLALIYEDEDGIIPIAQPGAKTNSLGVFDFYAASGNYNFTATVNGEVRKIGGVNASSVITESSGSVQDFIDASKTTILELASGKFQPATKVIITDRSYAPFDVKGAGWPQSINDLDVLDAGGGKVAVYIKNGPVNIRHLGAKGDGVANDSAAVIKAGDLGDIYADKGDYKLAGLQLKAGQALISDNATFIPATISSTCITADKVDRWSIVGRVTFKGSKTTLVGQGGDTGEVGLKIIGCYNFSVETAFFTKIAGTGLLRTAAERVTPYYSEGGQYSTISCSDCVNGVYWGSEYEIFGNLKINGCDIGLTIKSGNISAVAGSISDNDVGVYIPSGPNNAHGICSGININHNLTLGILVEPTSQGFTFIGCHCYASEIDPTKGGILIKDSQGVNFLGGIYDCTVKVEESGSGAGWHSMRNIYTPNDYGLNIINEFGQRARTMITSGIIEKNGNPVSGGDYGCANTVSSCYYSLSRPASNRLLIPASTSTTLPFTNIERQGDAAGRISGAGPWSEFYMPKGVQHVSFTAAVAGLVQNSGAYITLLVDGAPHSKYFGSYAGVIAGDTLHQFNIDVDVAADSNISLALYHTTATPVYLGAESANNYLSIKTLTK